MPFYNFQELTWRDFAEFDRQKTLILVPIAPLEEHSYHLPFGVDLYNSDFFCKETGKIFAQNNLDYNVVLYPPIPLGSDCFRFPGTVDIDQRAIYLVVKSMGKNFNNFGFKNIMFVGLHGGPRHIAALEQASRELNRWYGMNTLAPFGTILMKMFSDRDFADLAIGRALSDDEWYRFERDIHGGFVETSLMLFHHPELVRENYKARKDYPLKIIEMRRHPFGRFSNWEGHLGYPSLSTKETGELLSKNMIIWFEGILKQWATGVNLKKYNRSLASKVQIFNVNFSRWLWFFGLIITALVLWLIFG